MSFKIEGLNAEIKPASLKSGRGTFLEFYLSSKDNLLIVTLVGFLNEEHGEIVSNCLEEIRIAEESFGVLYVRDLQDLDEIGFNIFRELVATMRDKFKQGFTICSAKPTFRLALTQREISEESEYSNNLKEVALMVSEIGDEPI